MSPRAPQNVEPQPARPPRVGLLAVAEVVNDGRWENGTTWVPESCPASAALAITALGKTASMAAGASGFATPVDAESFLVIAGLADSAFNFAGDSGLDWKARATRAVDAVASYHVARELWTGTLRSDPRPLASLLSDRVTSSAVSAEVALGLLEQALLDATKGQRGMIHVTVSTLAALVTNGTVRREGGAWLSPMDCLVVADAGYPGTGPGGLAAGSSQYAYATPPVRVRLSPTFTLPESPDDLPVGMTRSDNSFVLYAGRVALVEWDECAHFAAEINLAVPAVGGAS